MRTVQVLPLLALFAAFLCGQSHALLLNDTYYSVYLAQATPAFGVGAAAPIVKLGKDTENAWAWGKVTDLTTEAGTSKLFLHANPDAAFTSTDQAYAAGFLEGALSVNQTIWFCSNFAIWNLTAIAADTPLYDFFMQWDDFLQGSVSSNDGQNDPYWRHMQLLRLQVQGMADGHSAFAPEQYALDYFQLMFINSLAEMYNIMTAIAFQMAKDQSLEAASPLEQHKLLHDRIEHIFGAELAAFALNRKHVTRCSSLVKVLPDNADVLFTHTTWSGYLYMVRMWKLYDLPFNDDVLAGTGFATQVTFTSYPVYIFSLDDFYVNSNKVAITETTNDVYQLELFGKYTLSNSTLPVWYRAAAANRIAASAEEWTTAFTKYNSGTYNNQWIVFDYNLFIAGQPPSAGALWIAEQIPGYVHAEDMTSVLVGNTYWSSFNIPYFKDIYNMSDYPLMYVTSGGNPEYTHDHCARARIFDRDAPNVVDVASLRKLIRSNNFQTDPISQGNPGFAIAARFDLFGNATDNSASGAIDAKMTSSAQAAVLQWDAVAGPTHDEQPVFAWSTSTFPDDPHMGMPDAFPFEWVANAITEQ